MEQLSEEQIAFLRHHGVPLSRVFNASGLGKRQRERTMRQLGMELAYGVPPCDRANHTLRTRSGHCVQCGTHNLAFQRRYDEIGEVYVASSKKFGLVKIGAAQSAAKRLITLNYFQYGGPDDWKLCEALRCERAGRVEFAAQNELFKYLGSTAYEKQGSSVNCQELFSCTEKQAISALKRIVAKRSEGSAT